MRKNEMGEIGRTDRSRYHKIRRVLGTELEESKSFSHIWEEEISSPEEVFDRNLEKEYCHKLLSHLNGVDRKILLHIMEGYNSVEIGKLAGKSHSWASGRVRRLWYRLRFISRKLGLEDVLNEGRRDLFRDIWDTSDNTLIPIDYGESVFDDVKCVELSGEGYRNNIMRG